MGRSFFHFVTIHAFDGQTDGRTDRRTASSSLLPPCIVPVCSAVKKTTRYTTWRLDTCRHSANPCPAFLVFVTYARLVVANWTFHVNLLIWLRTGDRRLTTLVPHLGTLFLTVSRTLISLCKPSNAISKPSYFPILVHFSAFEVSYKNAPYKSTVIIINIIIITTIAALLLGFAS